MENAKQPASASGGNGNKNKVILITIVIVLLAVVCVLGATVFLLLRNKESDNQESYSNGVLTGPNRNTVVTMDNKDEILADLDNKVSKGMFETKMSVEWTFKNSSTPSEDSYVANVANNSNTVYFDVTLDATGETIYESPYIPVGHALKNVTLASDLSAGTHPCTLTYHLIDENYTDVSTTSVTVTLYVEE